MLTASVLLFVDGYEAKVAVPVMVLLLFSGAKHLYSFLAYGEWLDHLNLEKYLQGNMFIRCSFKASSSSG
jgi:hypothetical protein